MMRFLFFFLLLLGTCPQYAMATSTGAEVQPLRIFNWNDYIDRSVLDDFSRDTGIPINYTEYDDNVIPDARLTRGTADFDIVVPTALPYLERQIRAGLHQPLDKSKIPNLRNIDSQLAKLVETADPGNKHGVVYHWGTTGILYNPALVNKAFPNAPVQSLALVFDEANIAKLAKCGVVMLDSPTEIMPLVFRYLGRDPNTNNPQDYIDAELLLKRIRPHVRYFHSSRYAEELAKGELCVAIGWNGDTNLANELAAQQKTGQKILYSVPKEGTVVWFDTMAIPKTAKNPQAAHAFINYVLRPEVMARISNATGFANAVPSSHKFLQPAILANGVAYPREEDKPNLFTLAPTTLERAAALRQIWTRMRISHIKNHSENVTAVPTPAADSKETTKEMAPAKD